MPEEKANVGSLDDGGDNLKEESLEKKGSSDSETPVDETKSAEKGNFEEWVKSLTPDQQKDMMNLQQLYGKQTQELGDLRTIVKGLAPVMEELESARKSEGTTQPKTKSAPAKSPEEIKQSLEGVREILGDAYVDAQLAMLDNFQQEQEVLRKVAHKQFEQEHPDFKQMEKDVSQIEYELVSGKKSLREIAYELAKVKRMPEHLERAKKAGYDEATKPKSPPTFGGTGGDLTGAGTIPDELGRTPAEVQMLDNAVNVDKGKKEKLKELLE